MVITNMKYLDVYDNMRNLDGYYIHEIPGCFLPTRDTLMVIANMRYLDGYYQHEIPRWLLPT